MCQLVFSDIINHKSKFLKKIWTSSLRKKSFSSKIVKITHFLRLNKNCPCPLIIFIFGRVVNCYLPQFHLKFELTATNDCGDVNVQSYFVKAKSAKFAFQLFLSLPFFSFWYLHFGWSYSGSSVYSYSKIPNVFSRGRATLHLAVSVGRRRSVGRSVGRLVGR